MAQANEQNRPAAPIHWTAISDNPNHPDAKANVRRVLKDIERVRTDTDVVGWIEKAAAGKRVLDIGMASHSEIYWGDRWPHRRFAKVASSILGIDILESLIGRLAADGYNVRVADATSDADLGERFDLVLAMDVIEHVDNPVGLMKFCARHLAPGGRVLVSTPNPFSRKFIRQFRRQKQIIVNLDHVIWVTPTMALEIAHRSGLELKHLHLIKPMSKWKAALKRLTWRFEAIEYSFPDYLYEFTVPGGR